MAAISKTRLLLPSADRRFFLWSLAGLGLSTKMLKSEKRSEPVYRFLTPECEVRMSVEYFASPSSNSFRFRDRLTNRGFCLSSNGDTDRACVARFQGSMAIARYDFRSRLPSPAPLNLRERVLTIDHDSRMSPRPPFERVLAVEQEVVSDIQAFGYNLDDPQPTASNTTSLAVWCLLRQDLYLNDHTNAFLIVHWGHMLNFIDLVDVIPGDGTQLIGK